MTPTIISEAGDLIIEVVQYDDTTSDADGNRAPQAIAQFKVDRKVLIEASQPLLKMLLDPRWKEATQSVVSIDEGRVASTAVWLRVIHKATPDITVPFEEIWHLVAAIDYYGLDVTVFYRWFAAWYSSHNLQLLKPRELLFPTWRFDHAKGFAKWTRYLAYQEKGHITEGNSTKLHRYHLPQRIVQQLNAAKGRLRTVLHRGLFGPCAALFDSDCQFKEKTLFGYQKHLVDLDVWPLETVFQRSSMNEILDRLKNFKFEATSCPCEICQQDFKGKITGIEYFVRHYFDGLCLDCLDRSKPKLGDADMDYWQHNKLREHDWIENCRFPHKQPTWYFSFNGRKEERDRLVKKFDGTPGSLRSRSG